MQGTLSNPDQSLDLHLHRSAATLRRTRLEELMILEEPEEDEAARVYLQISQARERLAAENARRNIVRSHCPSSPPQCSVV